jgi:hypothetical protein
VKAFRTICAVGVGELLLQRIRSTTVRMQGPVEHEWCKHFTILKISVLRGGETIRMRQTRQECEPTSCAGPPKTSSHSETTRSRCVIRRVFRASSTSMDSKMLWISRDKSNRYLEWFELSLP